MSQINTRFNLKNNIKEQNKPKTNRKHQIIKMRTEINEIEISIVHFFFNFGFHMTVVK